MYMYAILCCLLFLMDGGEGGKLCLSHVTLVLAVTVSLPFSVAEDELYSVLLKRETNTFYYLKNTCR